MILGYLFRCRHQNITWPRTVRGPQRWRIAAAVTTSTYVCCLDCARELPYDLENMRILTSKRQRRAYLAALTAGILLLSVLSCGSIATKPNPWLASKGEMTVTVTPPTVGIMASGSNDVMISGESGRTLLTCDGKQKFGTSCRLGEGVSLDDLVLAVVQMQKDAERLSKADCDSWKPTMQFLQDKRKNKL
jgi:hypothetical protein